jgi:lipopolysaccharide transport system permease protein
VLGLGLGMIISSLVTKYRDFSYLIGFGVQLLMYVSAVVYPMAWLQQNARVRLVGQVQSTSVYYRVPLYAFECGELSVFGLLYTFGNDDRIFSRYSDFNKTEEFIEF